MTGVQTCALPICFPVTISQFYKSPADFSLWEIGAYETDNAELTSIQMVKAVAQATEYATNKPALAAAN